MRFPFRKASDIPTEGGAAVVRETRIIEIDAGAIDSAFVAPKWLRDIGMTSWYAVGAALLLLSIIAVLSITSTIVIPVIVAGVVAAVAAPLVSWLQSFGVPRAVGTILLVLTFVLILAGVGYAVMSGIVSQSAETSTELRKASGEITAWLSDHGIDPKEAQSAQASVEKSTTRSVSALLSGVVDTISSLTGIVFGLAMMLISLIFLLKDGPVIRAWGERHMGVPQPVARVVTGRVIGSLRGYFLGVTIIAAFNALVVGIGAWLFDVPLLATIVVVTFVCAYVPFVGAWAAGIFAVLIAFGSPNEAAVPAMIIIQLLANGALQQIVQPIAYGAALGIHPLAALIATIGAGCLFGSIGLILGAPMVSAAVRITSDLANARAAEAGDADLPVDTSGLPAPSS